eukprot:gene49413-16422_t
MEEGARGAALLVHDKDADPQLLLAYLQRTWLIDPPGRPSLLKVMDQFAQRLGIDPGHGQTMPREVQSARSWRDVDEHNSFAYEVLLTHYSWQREMAPHDYHMLPHRTKIDACLTLATKYRDQDRVDGKPGKGYRAWHGLALLHLRIALRDQSLTQQEQGKFASQACDEFVRSIQLCDPPEMAVQDMLRLL